MARSDKFFQAIGLMTNDELNATQANLSAAYVQAESKYTGIASPWADASHLETMVLSDAFGITPDLLPVNRASAMQIASLAKGRNLICTSIARMPLHATKGGTPVADQPALLKQLDPHVTNFNTLSWTIDSMLFKGRAFWLISEKTFDGRPLHIRYVPEEYLEADKGILTKAFGKNVGPKDFIRLDANHEGLLNYGVGVIREAQEIEAAAREAGANPVPAINLAQQEGSDLTEAKITSLLARWNAARRRRGGSTSYTNKGVEVQQIGQHNENLLIDARNVASLQVARALSLPAWAVDASVQGTSLSYSNQASRNREILDALTAYIVSIEQTISMFLPAGTNVKFDTAELLKEDTKGRYENYKTAIESGLLTVNEARALENLPPVQDEPTESPVQPELQPSDTEEPNE